MVPGVFEIIQDGDTWLDFIWQHNEPIFILIGDSANTPPVFSGGHFRTAWVIQLFPPEEEGVVPIPPTAGDVIRISTSKPFRNGESFRFTSSASRIDEDLAKTELKSVYVVPNPYVATSLFEPANTYRSGRGERRIYFMNLPLVCTITIYTKRGHFVTRVQHDGRGSDGQESWDLVSQDGMNIAYGVYFYVVEAYGEESVGIFAVIK